MTVYLKIEDNHIKYSNVESILVETYHITLRLKKEYNVKTPYQQNTTGVEVLCQYNMCCKPYIHIFDRSITEILSVNE